MKKLIRKIHLWLSVPFGIIITLVCFSGASLLFEKEINELCRPYLYFVDEVKAKPLPLDSLMQSVAATLPDSVSITGVTCFPQRERTWQVSLSQPRRASLFVNPYTGEVTGRNERLPFFDTMFHLHRWLLGASQTSGGGMPIGKLLVGTSTLVLIVILITGLLMWLTNKHKPLKKSLTICCTRGWGRFWHDLHVAGGIYATLFLLAVALTGLTWSFSWYRTGFYSLLGVENSAEGAAQGGGHGRSGNADSRSRGEGRPNRDGEGRAQRDGEGRPQRDGEDRSHRDGEGRSYRRHPYARWQEVYESLAQQHPGYRQITLQEGKASVVPAGRQSLRATDSFEFDRRSGEITSSKPYSESDRATRVRSAVYQIHVGSWGGLFTRILTFLSVLIGFTLPLTGYYLWIRRISHKGKHNDRSQASESRV